MKRFSSNLTDEEFQDLFREAAEHYNPKLNDSEKQEAWESIANSLPAAPKRRKACLLNKWKKRGLALLMLWLLTGGLTFFRIIQLQESNDQNALVAPKVYRAPRLTYDQVLAALMELKYVDADCRVIDWPVNIRYDLLIQSNSYFFISAGTSSYLMQKEDYTLNYDAFGAMVQQKDLSYNENQHLFVIANVSAGYEYHWKRLSLQAAPYVKVPARGIGVGKAKLGSGGIFFSLKYRY